LDSRQEIKEKKGFAQKAWGTFWERFMEKE
jgi:hypothetical protein